MGNNEVMQELKDLISKEDLEKMFMDEFLYGQCVYKIKDDDGKITMEYIDPRSPELNNIYEKEDTNVDR